MDSTETGQTQSLYSADEITLKDIFYRDATRLNSLISQIEHGTLQEVTETGENTTEENTKTKANLGFTRAFGSEYTVTESENIKKTLQSRKAVYDEIVLRLLRTLSINPKTESKTEIFSCLDIFQGEVSLINYEIFFDMIPLFKRIPELFYPQFNELEKNKALLSIAKKNKNKSTEDKAYIRSLEKGIAELTSAFSKIGKTIDTFDAMKDIFPSGIGFELKMLDNSIFTGNLKTEYLIDTEKIVFNNYGGVLPDVWNILGIVDYKTQNDIPTKNKFSVLSRLSSEAKNIFTNSKSKGTIVPILIYRELNLG